MLGFGVGTVLSAFVRVLYGLAWLPLPVLSLPNLGFTQIPEALGEPDGSTDDPMPRRVHAVPLTIPPMATAATSRKKQREIQAMARPLAAGASGTSNAERESSRRMLEDRPVRWIARSVAATAARWLDARFPPRQNVLDAVRERTGYSAAAVAFAFDHLFGALTDQAIEATIARELGSLEVLDRWEVRADGAIRRALPIGSVAVISSRTTIGVAMFPAIFALCAKCRVLVKDREDRLLSAFFATLAEEDRRFEGAARAEVWNSDDDARDLRSFDAVVAFGGDSTLEAIGARLPGSTRFIPYGAKASVGYLAREALSNETSARHLARGAARDLVLYESQGCLSLHALFVERGGTVAPERFAELLADAMATACAEFAPEHPAAQTVAALANARDLAIFRAAAGQGRVYADRTARFLAVLDPPNDRPPAFLPRTLGVHGVDGPSEAAAYLARHGVPVEAMAIAGERDDLLALAAAAGASRVADFGALQTPPANAYHGGRPRIAEFVRWIADERRSS